MYVCLCNALCDRSVARAIASGADHEDAVHEALGCEVVCGRCKPTIRAMIVEEAMPRVPEPAE